MSLPTLATSARPEPTAAIAALLAALLLTGTPASAQVTVRPEARPGNLKPLPMRMVGRVERAPDGMLRRQWPGTYFETAFRGSSAYVRVGAGKVALRVRVDGATPIAMMRPAPGFYRISGVRPGAHRVRVDVASESQAGPTDFGGFYAPPGVQASAIARRARQIEFIGDSQTVGYGNLSPTRVCTDERVWETTDTSRGLAPLTAGRYGADYQVNAISGRGIVRNYGGTIADTLPQAYPYVLFDKRHHASHPGWNPAVVVIGLGANDFSTPLASGEKWTSRGALRADFEANYVRFVRGLRLRYPRARFVLWATDQSDGEVIAEVRKVASKLAAAGETRVDVLALSGLALTGCNYHPGLSDDAAIASALAKSIDRHPGVWAGK
jgi:lysophospholipase L1-like esterase